MNPQVSTGKMLGNRVADRQRETCVVHLRRRRTTTLALRLAPDRLGKVAVIGVSTKPGLIVSTCTPVLVSRLRSPCMKRLTMPLAAPYT